MPWPLVTSHENLLGIIYAICAQDEIVTTSNKAVLQLLADVDGSAGGPAKDHSSRAVGETPLKARFESGEASSPQSVLAHKSFNP
jgi:hypothetical protein